MIVISINQTFFPNKIAAVFVFIHRLADPSGGGNLSGYISSDYIFDSIKHNRLQDLKKYRLVMYL